MKRNSKLSKLMNEPTTWGVYEIKKERDITENLFSKYEKKKAKIHSPLTEQRDLIAKMLNRSFPHVAGLTKDWTVEEMYLAYNTALKWKTNSVALLWKLIKEKNNEKKAKGVKQK